MKTKEESFDLSQEISSILWDLDFLKENQQWFHDYIKSSLILTEEQNIPKFKIGDIVCLEIEPGFNYLIRDIIVKKHEYAYTIAPIDDTGYVLIGVDEYVLTKPKDKI
jgi:hypothetical protein